MVLEILQSFGYNSFGELGLSLAPSFKYHITLCVAIVSGLSSAISLLFGLDALAFLALLIAFLFELVSGLKAASVRGEEFQSSKMSRFSFKVFYYLIIICLSWVMTMSFEYRGRDIASMFFSWLHIFLIVQIVLENIVSISENISVISGKPKSHWITSIQEKVNSIFKT